MTTEYNNSMNNLNMSALHGHLSGLALFKLVIHSRPNNFRLRAAGTDKIIFI